MALKKDRTEDAPLPDLFIDSDAIKIYHKEMKHASEENEEVPDYVHVFYALRLIEEDSHGVCDTAEDEEDNAVHSDGIVIGPAIT